MAEEDQNRNEPATPHKREEARKKGSVAKSLDVNSFMVLSGAVGALYLWGHSIINDELVIFHNIFMNTYRVSFELKELSHFLTNLLAAVLLVLAPLFALLIALGILANFMQTGPIFTFFPLKPDLNRINPIAGLKRMFSMKLLIEAVKTVLKFVFLGTVLYAVISAAVPNLITAFQVHPVSIGSILFPMTKTLLVKLLLALILIAGIDLIYSRLDYSKRLRMSRRDITDEHKRREGDPRVKSRLRELQREAVKRAKSLGKVKDADVLITNPTHVAVAIKYDKNTSDAPMVIAKGAGFLAYRMKSIARRHRVPIVESRQLARNLFYQIDIDRVVPAEHYTAIAKILVWVYSLTHTRHNSGARPV